jgi:hypothetical protein
MELNLGRGRHVLDDVVVVILQFDSDEKNKNCGAATTAIATTMFHIFVLLQVLIVPSIIQTCHNLLKWTVRILRYKHLKEHFYLLSEYIVCLEFADYALKVILVYWINLFQLIHWYKHLRICATKKKISDYLKIFIKIT